MIYILHFKVVFQVELIKKLMILMNRKKKKKRKLIVETRKRKKSDVDIWYEYKAFFIINYLDLYLFEMGCC